MNEYHNAYQKTNEKAYIKLQPKYQPLTGMIQYSSTTIIWCFQDISAAWGLHDLQENLKKLHEYLQQFLVIHLFIIKYVASIFSNNL